MKSSASSSPLAFTIDHCSTKANSYASEGHQNFFNYQNNDFFEEIQENECEKK